MEKWYVKSTQGKVFGPILLDELKKWVAEGRVEPLAGISQDLKNWMLAPLNPDLEMDWVVENNPGQFYGPTHRAVVDDLRHAAQAVAAHLRARPVGVEHQHLAVGLRVRGDDDQAVGADPEAAVRDEDREGGEVEAEDFGELEGVHVDVVVPGAVHLDEFHATIR